MELTVEAFVALQHSVDQFREAVRQYHNDLVRSSERPKSIVLSAQATADSTGTAQIVFPASAYGREMSVRRLTIGGVSWTTTASGTALVSVATSAPSPDAPVPTTQVLDSANTLPAVAFYNGDRHLVPLRGGNALIVTVINGTAGQTYYASATMDDYPER